MDDPVRHPAILASDAERQRAVAVLRDAVVEGRLTLEEQSHELVVFSYNIFQPY